MKAVGRPGVLIADDEHFVRTMLLLGLEQYGFEVHAAADGREAVAVYQQHRERIAVVLLDVIMPGLDGPQTLTALRELNPNIPACFMTGDMGTYDSQQLLECGAAKVVTKPFYLGQMAGILQRLVQGEAGDPVASDGQCKA
jgi:CheY-like chemotaxis protein